MPTTPFRPSPAADPRPEAIPVRTITERLADLDEQERRLAEMHSDERLLERRRIARERDDLEAEGAAARLAVKKAGRDAVLADVPGLAEAVETTEAAFRRDADDLVKLAVPLIVAARRVRRRDVERGWAISALRRRVDDHLPDDSRAQIENRRRFETPVNFDSDGRPTRWLSRSAVFGSLDLDELLTRVGRAASSREPVLGAHDGWVPGDLVALVRAAEEEVGDVD